MGICYFFLWEELQVAERFWITQAQAVRAPKSDVNLEKDEDGILRCVSRVPGFYPISLPRKCELTSLVVLQVHKQMLHGGLSVTMCRMQEKYWVSKLRSLTKKVIQNCNVCKCYQEKPISVSHVTTAALPTFRIEMSDPFAVTGVDFTGSVYFRVKKSVTAKAYIALFTCTSARAVHLKLCLDLSSAEFQISMPSDPCKVTMEKHSWLQGNGCLPSRRIAVLQVTLEVWR